MEKEGFIRGMTFLQKEGILIDEIVTDRHVAIRKYIKDELKDIKHSFDVWHIAKSKVPPSAHALVSWYVYTCQLQVLQRRLTNWQN